MLPCELNKGTLTFRQRGRVPQGRPLYMSIATDNILLVIIVTKSNGELRLK